MNRIVFAAIDEASARSVAEMLDRKGIATNVNDSFGVEALSDDDVARAQAALAEVGSAVAPAPASIDVASALLGPRVSAPSLATTTPAVMPPSQAPSPIVPASTATPTAAELAQGKRDLVWVLLGCVPLAVTFLWFDQNPAALSWLSRVGRSALGNAVSSLELLLCLNLVHHGRKDLRQLWGGGRHAVPMVLGALALGGLLFAVWWVVFHLLYQGVVPHLLPSGSAKSAISGVDWLIFSLTTTIAAGATGLTIYGVVLKQLIALLRSRFVAVLMAAAIATVVWNLAASPAQLGAEFVRQIILATAVLFVGRVWPVSLASAACTVLIWIRFDRP